MAFITGGLERPLFGLHFVSAGIMSFPFNDPTRVFQGHGCKMCPIMGSFLWLIRIILCRNVNVGDDENKGPWSGLFIAQILQRW